MAPATRDIACRELVELLTDHLEGALDAEEVAAIERHLSGCDGCAAYLEQLRATIALLGTAGVGTLPDETVDELVVLFRSLLA